MWRIACLFRAFVSFGYPTVLFDVKGVLDASTDNLDAAYAVLCAFDVFAFFDAVRMR